ncbi:MAG: hypothetical protein QM674_20025 [Burkholderiaceae bacterium]
MPIDPRRLLARPFPPIEQTYAFRDTQIYALGLGIDPLDPGPLSFAYEGQDGASLRAEIWVRGNTVSLRVTAVERGVVVLNNARVDLR